MRQKKLNYLLTDPNDFEVRFKLMLCYANYRYFDRETQEKFFTHFYWTLENKPDAEEIGCGVFFVDKEIDREYIPRLIELYEKALLNFSNSAAVHFNAGWFYRYLEDQRAELLLLKSCVLDPTNTLYTRRVAQHYKLLGSAESLEKSVNWYEKTFKLFDGNDEEQFYLLDDLARVYLLEKDFIKAEFYAHDLLKKAESYQDNWNYGNALHWGKIVLGELAFEKGDLVQACEQLLQASETLGSPQLNSFGPDLDLAQKLIDSGKLAEVAKYLSNCLKFWKSDRDLCDKATELLGKREQINLRKIQSDLNKLRAENEINKI